MPVFTLQNVEAQDPRGRTLLHLAVSLGHLESARVLLRHKADVTKENREGWTGKYACKIFYSPSFQFLFLSKVSLTHHCPQSHLHLKTLSLLRLGAGTRKWEPRMLPAGLQHSGLNCVLGPKPWVEGDSSSRRQLSVQTLPPYTCRGQISPEERDGNYSDSFRIGKIKKKLWLKGAISSEILAFQLLLLQIPLLLIRVILCWLSQDMYKHSPAHLILHVTTVMQSHK